MPIANYTTNVPAVNSATEIERMLEAHNARAIVKEYGPNRDLIAMSFVVPTKHGNLPFSLPANSAAVKRVLQRQAVRSVIDDARTPARRVEDPARLGTGPDGHHRNRDGIRRRGVHAVPPRRWPDNFVPANGQYGLQADRHRR